MPIEIRRDDSIFRADGGWFEARWHFSFSQYRDPTRMGVGPLRVFNDDRLVPGGAWPMHPHRDVESLTYVVEGSFGRQLRSRRLARQRRQPPAGRSAGDDLRAAGGAALGTQ
jgi:redox-sensitive bicupin YhaK (pirin superfamily)